MDHHLHTFSLLFSLLVVSFWIDHNSSSVGYLWCLMVYSQHLHHICKLLCQHYQYSPKKLSSPKSKSKISNPKIQGFGLWLTIKLLGPPTHPQLSNQLNQFKFRVLSLLDFGSTTSNKISHLYSRIYKYFHSPTYTNFLNVFVKDLNICLSNPQV